MKLSIERNPLLRSLSRALSIAQAKSSLPILSNLLIEVDEENDAVYVRATDLEMEVVERIPSVVRQPGAFTVSVALLHDIVRKFQDGSLIEFDHDSAQNRLKIRSAKSEFALGTIPSVDFPAVIKGEYTSSFRIKVATLRPLFEKPKFAMSAQESRFYLNGLYMHIASTDHGNVLRCVATDGHRLAQVDTPAPAHSDGMPAVIVPRKAVTEIGKMSEIDDQELEISISDAMMRFATSEFSLTVRAIEGTFPDYTNVIPKNNTLRLEVNAKEFATAVDRVATVSLEKSRAIKLRIENNHLAMSVRSADTGLGEEELEVRYDAEPINIGFNAQYLYDIVSQMDQETAVLFLATPGDPAILYEGERTDALYVVMPMRV